MEPAREKLSNYLFLLRFFVPFLPALLVPRFLVPFLPFLEARPFDAPDRFAAFFVDFLPAFLVAFLAAFLVAFLPAFFVAFRATAFFVVVAGALLSIPETNSSTISLLAGCVGAGIFSSGGVPGIIASSSNSRCCANIS